MEQKIVNIKAVTLPDAWFQLIYNILKYGRDFTIDQGSFAGSIRKELDFVMIHILNPWERDVDGFPLIPVMPEGSNVVPPVTRDYLIQYAPYLMTGEIADGESYTYGSRLHKEPVSKDISDGVRSNWDIYRKYVGSNQLESIVFDSEKYLSQVELAIEVFKEHQRTNQMCLQIAKPTDMLYLDPPCLRLIDIRIQDNKLHFYLYFRSWDAYTGTPANLAIISMLQEYMASEIGVEQGEMICMSKGAHIYSSILDFAKARCLFD